MPFLLPPYLLVHSKVRASRTPVPQVKQQLVILQICAMARRLVCRSVAHRWGLGYDGRIAARWTYPTIYP